MDNGRSGFHPDPEGAAFLSLQSFSSKDDLFFFVLTDWNSFFLLS